MIGEHMQPANSGVLPIELVTSRFLRFARMEAAGGILLLISTVAALAWANSPWAQIYHELWNTKVTIGFGRFLLSETRLEWINDGLMSIFFFLVGLEIKREVLIGELSSLRRAAFPFVAAVGGTVIPALIYALTTSGNSDVQKGWGIPMATDIAFALGVLSLLGSRVPVSLKIFVAALAIVDDIIAVLVIAFFYTDKIAFFSLAVGLAGVVLGSAANLLGLRKPVFYAAIGIFVWCAVLESGVHATIAGVLLSFTIPARTYIDRDLFLERGRRILDKFELASPDSAEAHAAIHTLEEQCELVQSPLHRIEHSLHPLVSFLVMPLFAFANAGVGLLGNILPAMKHPASMGVALGLFIGKPVGICMFAWLSVRTRVAVLPSGLSWRMIFGAACLCGIGFTMALFIATLAFGEGAILELSKIGILAASLSAGVCGCVLLLRKT
jgi:NhaA family Na+:H+ antiporter